MHRYPLASTFRARADLADAAAGDGYGDELAALEARLATLAGEAARAWPGVVVSAEDFAAYLGERVARRPESLRPLGDDALDGLHATDLYLAAGCVAGDSRALALFEERMLAAVDGALLRLRLERWVIDETKQVLRCRFFLPRSGDRPSPIADYAGYGPLTAWVTAAAVHASLRIVRPTRGETTLDSVVLKAISRPGDDLEIEYLKRRYASALESALLETFGALEPRERNILRTYHLDGAGIDGVAALYRVHRVTAWRWVRQVTAQLFDRTRRLLVERADGNRAEISSILRLIESQIDAIVRSALAASVDPR